MWASDAGLKLPVLRQAPTGSRIAWREPAFHSVHQILRHPIYAGAYVFGRTGQRTAVVDGRVRKTIGHNKPISSWNLLIRDHHGRVRAEPNDAVGERPYAKAYGPQVGPRRAGASDGPRSMWSLRSDDARLLWNTVRTCASVSMPGRQCDARHGALHWNRRSAKAALRAAELAEQRGLDAWLAISREL